MKKLFQKAFQAHCWVCNLQFKFLSLIAIIPVIIFRVIFMITYPLNNFGGDTSNYFNMMLEGKSSLVHASGYPFLFGFLLNNFRNFFQVHPFISGYFLLITQHAIEILCMLLVLWVLWKLYNPYVAILSIWFWGLNVWAASTTSSIYPEWFQSVLLITSFCLLYLAFKAPVGWKKFLFYTAASLVFFWCYLVKFNVLYFVLIFIIIFLIEKIPFKTKTFYTMLIAFLIVINMAGFLVFYHEPSTGTHSLSYDHGWVLTDKVWRFIAPENGIDSKRLLVLNALLPQNYSAAGPVTYSHVNAVVANERLKYRHLYDRVMAADEKTLDALLLQHPLPDTFKAYYSTIVVSYYIGLPEGDDLGIRAYLDVLRTHPIEYFNLVLLQTRDALVLFKPDLLVPTTNLFQEEKYTLTGFNNFGFRKCDLPGGEYWNAPYWSNKCIFWWPGVRLFSVLQTLLPLGYVSSIIVLIGFCVCLIQISTDKKITLKTLIPAVFPILILGYIIFSNVIYNFRWKEFRLVFSLICILCSIGLYNILSLVIKNYVKGAK